ncbi:hypothetical protein IT408_04825 [Candidatus Uhrbacteria bacterium]|nr:hypothetical protein [Candidatus Uhrbacteria bacterium]
MKKYRIGIFIVGFVILFDLGLWLALTNLSFETSKSAFSSMKSFSGEYSGQGMTSSLILHTSQSLRIE